MQFEIILDNKDWFLYMIISKRNFSSNLFGYEKFGIKNSLQKKSEMLNKEKTSVS